MLGSNRLFYLCAIVTLSVKRAVFEIFKCEKCGDLQFWVRGHSRSLKVVPFETGYGFLLVFYSNFFPKMRHFGDIRLVSIVTLKPGLGSLKVIGTDTDQSATYDFLLTFHSNHGPISYPFRDKWRFRSKVANFHHPMYFALPLKGLPSHLGIWYGAWGRKTRMMGLPE